MTELQAEVVLAFADCNMSATDTARKLFCHRNTVLYHFHRIKLVTRLDPMNFHDLIVLESMAQSQYPQLRTSGANTGG